MEEKLLDIEYRKKVIWEIKSDENVQRKIVSYKKMSMQNDNFHQYVKEYLESKYDPETVQEMCIFSNVNLQRRVSKAEASIYTNEPDRTFMVGDRAIDEMDEVYSDMDADTVLKRANEAYKYQEQCAIQAYPEDGQLKSRVLLPHHYDVIPYDHNSEKAMAYIVSSFDNTDRDKVERNPDRTGFSQGHNYRDGIDQKIADYDDPQLEKERLTWWSESYNFVTDGHGRIINKETNMLSEEPSEEDVMSPLAEFKCLPFIDVATAKDFEFWVRSGDALYDATLMLNTIFTSEFQTVEMQGHAQAVYKGSADHMPENIRVGVDKVIHIPIDPQNPTNSDFDFVNPGSDLGGIRQFRESFIKSFLSSRGLDASIVSGEQAGQKASSGFEKLLQMIEKFEASQEDFALFRKVEKKLCKIVACWIKATPDLLGPKYGITIPNLEDFECKVEFGKPQLIKTEMEQLETLEKELELEITSRVHYLMEHKEMTEDQAIEYLRKVDEYAQIVQTEVQQEGSLPEIQS